MTTVELKDSLIIFSTILGPILAVQAQKWVERVRNKRNRKMWVFHTLMATRASRVAPEHVQALNMIDLAFYGRKVLGTTRRTKNEQAVLDTWHEYLDHLGTKVEDANYQIWTAQRDELFINLLFAIASDLGFTFDRVQLKKGAYSPIAHGELEQDLTEIRKLALKVLSGDTSIKMDISRFPLNESAIKAQADLQLKLAGTIDEDGYMKVKIQQDQLLS